MTSSFKKDESKIRSFTGIQMLLMVEKGIRGRMCDSIYQYAQAKERLW